MATVIRNLDVNVATFMNRPQHQPPLCGFTCRKTYPRLFNTVVHTIAHQMGQRVGDRLNQGFV